jgi:hypothetical protein
MHPIDKEDIEMSAIAIHRGNPSRAASFPGMRRSVRGSKISLGFDDTSPVPFPSPVAGDPGSEEFPRDDLGVAAIELSRGFVKHTRLRIETQARVRNAFRYHARET